MPNYDSLPLFPLHTVLFPCVPLPLHIFEERYREMIARCIETKEPFGVVLIESGNEVDNGSGTPILSHIGTTARIERSEKMPDGRYFIEALGETRFEICDIFEKHSYMTARVKPLWEQPDHPLHIQPVFDQACELFRSYISSLLAETRRHIATVQLPEDPWLLSYAIGAALQVTLAEKQRLLEIDTVGERLGREIEILQMERETRAYLGQDATKAKSPADSKTDRKRTIQPLNSSHKKDIFSRN